MTWAVAAILAIVLSVFLVWSLSKSPPGAGMQAFGILVGFGAIAAGGSMASSPGHAGELGLVVALGLLSVGLLVAGAIREASYERAVAAERESEERARPERT